mgnify:CR=1 FL=1
MATSIEIPIFFATDHRYAPFLTVALTSLLDHATAGYIYKVYVLTTDLKDDYKKMIRSVLEKFPQVQASVDFISLAKELNKMGDLFHLRDYYSKETYYRFFIPNLFPKYNKAIYVDCDMIFLRDIAELYETDIEGYLLAAAPEEVMQESPQPGLYVEKALGIDRNRYFSAGLMVMNTAEFRRQKIAERFVDLLQRFTFRVTQDEDYLNVLCKDKFVMLDLGWNKSAFKNDKFDDADLKLVHYKINWKPWHYENIDYENYFWDYARKAGLYDMLIYMRDTYTDGEKKRDQQQFDRLMEMCLVDAQDPDNYHNTMQRMKKRTSVYRAFAWLGKIVRVKKLVNLGRMRAGGRNGK